MKSHHVLALPFLIIGLLFSLSSTSYAKSSDTKPHLQFDVTIKDLTSGEAMTDTDNEVLMLEAWHSYEVTYTCSNTTLDTTAQNLYINLMLPDTIKQKGSSSIDATLRSVNAEPSIIAAKVPVSASRDLFAVVNEEYNSEVGDFVNDDIGKYLKYCSNYQGERAEEISVSYIFQAVPKWSLSGTTTKHWLTKTNAWGLFYLIAIAYLVIVLFFSNLHYKAKYREKICLCNIEISGLEENIENLEQSLRDYEAENDSLAAIINDLQAKLNRKQSTSGKASPGQPQIFKLDEASFPSDPNSSGDTAKGTKQ